MVYLKSPYSQGRKTNGAKIARRKAWSRLSKIYLLVERDPLAGFSLPRLEDFII